MARAAPGAGFVARCLLGALVLPTVAAAAASNLSLGALATSFWSTGGLLLPSKDLVDACVRKKLPVQDSFGARREVILMTIVSEYALNRMFDIFLESLANISFPLKDGTTSSLVQHLVINVMNEGASLDKCMSIARGAACVRYSFKDFTSGNFDVHSSDFYGIGFVKTATILDGLSLGLDVLFLDADQVLFRNPLPYLLARQADVLVTGDCHRHDDMSPQPRLPPINNNIGFVYFRPTAMVARAVLNWALHLAKIAWRGEKPWDQSTFAGALEDLSTDVGVRHLSMAMLRPDLYPYLCMAQCGCDLRNVPYYANGKLPKLFRNDTFYYCEPSLMEHWYAFHFPCAGTMDSKAALMAEYARMYHAVVGPINTKSERMTTL